MGFRDGDSKVQKSVFLFERKERIENEKIARRLFFHTVSISEAGLPSLKAQKFCQINNYLAICPFLVFNKILIFRPLITKSKQRFQHFFPQFVISNVVFALFSFLRICPLSNNV